jgi:hypothetical protein
MEGRNRVAVEILDRVGSPEEKWLHVELVALDDLQVKGFVAGHASWVVVVNVKAVRAMW